MIAVEMLDPAVKAIIWAIALILFTLAAFGVGTSRVNMVAAGLAFMVLPFFWDALASA